MNGRRPATRSGSSKPSRLALFLRNVFGVAYKESMLLRRNPAVIASVISQPIMMLMLFGYALSSKPANVDWAVLDQSRSSVSRQLIAEIQASGYFRPRRDVTSYDEGLLALRRGRILALVVAPVDLARETARGRGQVQVLLDGADPLAAARVGGYLRAIAAETDTTANVRSLGGGANVELRQRFWFNPTMVDSRFLLVSLAGMILTNFCLSVASFGLVSEKEEGTWEQTLALPVSVVELVLGKLVPAVALCYLLLVISILGPGLVFGLWPAGSLTALVILTLPFVLASLGVGVFISTISETVAQSVFIAVFAIMPSFVLSGVMMPYELMPTVPRWVGALAPLRWYQIGVRRIFARGGGLEDVFVPLLVLVVMFAACLALIRYTTRPRLG